MQKPRRSGMVLAAMVALLAMSLPASAAPTESEDTSFSYAYDEAFHVLVWSISDTETPCVIGSDLTYQVDDSGVAVSPAAPSDEDCELKAAVVEGPNGQINHGMFMKLFNSLFEGKVRGCVNRYLAQSSLGKGDQKIKAGDDIDPTFVPVATDDPATLLFDTFLADCTHGKADKDDSSSTVKSKGKSDLAPGKSGDSPGKSGSAPGKNK